jgi:hypothetical protein
MPHHRPRFHPWLKKLKQPRQSPNLQTRVKQLQNPEEKKVNNVLSPDPGVPESMIEYETFERCSILFKFKEREDFNRRNTFEYFED